MHVVARELKMGETRAGKMIWAEMLWWEVSLDIYHNSG
jgi:hypothetical protein